MVEEGTLTLAYQHAGNELSTGAFFLDVPNEKATKLLERFEQLSYIDMMKKFAKHLTENPDVGAVIQRTDRPGLVALRMPDDEVALFRTDPAEAIRQRIIPPQVVHVGVDKSKRQEAWHLPTLAAGYDAIVECFGDVVFARVRGRDGEYRVECACCGNWCQTSQIDANRYSYRCTECGTWLPIKDYKPQLGWAGLEVLALLELNVTQFFLPRRWNPNGNWINRSDLLAMYTDYLKEKNE